MMLALNNPHRPVLVTPPEERVRKTLAALGRAGENRLEREMFYGREVSRLRDSTNKSLLPLLDRLGLNVIGEASDIDTPRTKLRSNEIAAYIWLSENWDGVKHIRKEGLTKAQTALAIRREWNKWVEELCLAQKRHKYVSDVEREAAQKRLVERDDKQKAKAAKAPAELLKKIRRLSPEQQQWIKAAI